MGRHQVKSEETFKNIKLATSYESWFIMLEWNVNMQSLRKNVSAVNCLSLFSDALGTLYL